MPCPVAGHGAPWCRPRPRLALAFAEPLGAGESRGGQGSLCPSRRRPRHRPSPATRLPRPCAPTWTSPRRELTAAARSPPRSRFPTVSPAAGPARGTWGAGGRAPDPCSGPRPAWRPPLHGSGLGIRRLIAAAPRKCPGSLAPGCWWSSKKEKGGGGERKERAPPESAVNLVSSLVYGILSCLLAWGPRSQVSAPSVPPAQIAVVTPECQGVPRCPDRKEAQHLQLKAPLLLLVTDNTVAARLLGFVWGFENEAKISLLKKK